MVVLLIGRSLRKAISQAFSFAAFRWIAIWLIIAACASKGQPGIAAALVVIAVDIISMGNVKATAFSISEQSIRDWKDRLTNRCFYKLLIEEIRAGNSMVSLDVDELFMRASAEADADIKRASDESHEDAGFLDTIRWHVFGGIISFIWQWVGSAIYYGSAIYFGSGGSY
jgi:hypothetical protein